MVRLFCSRFVSLTGQGFGPEDQPSWASGGQLLKIRPLAVAILDSGVLKENYNVWSHWLGPHLNLASLNEIPSLVCSRGYEVSAIGPAAVPVSFDLSMFDFDSWLVHRERTERTSSREPKHDDLQNAPTQTQAYKSCVVYEAF